MPEAKVTFLLNNLRIAYVLCYQPNHPSLNTQIWLIHRLYMPALILYVYFNIRIGFSIHVSMQMAPIILRAVYIKHTYIRKKYVFCFLGTFFTIFFLVFSSFLSVLGLHCLNPWGGGWHAKGKQSPVRKVFNTSYWTKL